MGLLWTHRGLLPCIDAIEVFFFIVMHRRHRDLPMHMISLFLMFKGFLGSFFVRPVWPSIHIYIESFV